MLIVLGEKVCSISRWSMFIWRLAKQNCLSMGFPTASLCPSRYCSLRCLFMPFLQKWAKNHVTKFSLWNDCYSSQDWSGSRKCVLKVLRHILIFEGDRLKKKTKTQQTNPTSPTPSLQKISPEFCSKNPSIKISNKSKCHFFKQIIN